MVLGFVCVLLVFGTTTAVPVVPVQGIADTGVLERSSLYDVDDVPRACVTRRDCAFPHGWDLACCQECVDGHCVKEKQD